jgi:hypothetical protein
VARRTAVRRRHVNRGRPNRVSLPNPNPRSHALVRDPCREGNCAPVGVVTAQARRVPQPFLCITAANQRLPAAGGVQNLVTLSRNWTGRVPPTRPTSRLEVPNPSPSSAWCDAGHEWRSVPGTSRATGGGGRANAPASLPFGLAGVQKARESGAVRTRVVVEQESTPGCWTTWLTSDASPTRNPLKRRWSWRRRSGSTQPQKARRCPV